MKFIQFFNHINRNFQAVLLLIMVIIMTSCSEDSAPKPEFDNSGSKEYLDNQDFYISLQITVPEENYSRSTTTPTGGSSNNTNNGFDLETKINTINLYFYDVTGTGATDDKLLCTFSTEASSNSLIKNGTSSSYTLVQKIDVNDIKQLFGKKLHIYALANLQSYPTGTNLTESQFLDQSFNAGTFGSGYSKLVGSQGMYCPMSNIEEFELDLTTYSESTTPSESEIVDIIKSLFTNSYTDSQTSESGKLWKISGNLSLQRMIARIDYKDGGEITSIAGVSNYTPTNLYVLPGTSIEISNCYSNVEGSKGVYLKLNNITLFNAAPSAFVFHHTSEGSLQLASAEDAVPFGIERNNSSDATKYNWIADNDWDTKSSTSFFNTPTVTSDSWSVSATEGIETADNIITNVIENYENDGYSPWYYIMENTVPSTAMMNLSNCTGVAFEMVIWDKTTQQPYKGNGAEVRINRDSDGYYQILKFNKTGTNEETGKDEGYYSLIYKYLIEHNLEKSGNVDQSTGKRGELGAMQIGIVRNNVYQLSLKGVSDLPNPHEPDDIVLTVNCKVKAWDVRWDEDVKLH